MCTLIGLIEKDRILVGMNRDNPVSRTHKTYHHNQGIFYPIDPLAGGTWLGVNKEGVVYALLNAEGIKPAQKNSRGEIIPQLLEGKITPSEMDVQAYNPFTLVELTYGSGARYSWNGEKWKSGPIRKEDLVLEVSSSYDKAPEKARFLQQNIPAEITIDSLAQVLKKENKENPVAGITMKGKRSQTIASTIIEIQNNVVTVYDIQGYPVGREYKKIVSFSR